MKSALKIRLLLVLLVTACSLYAQTYRLEVGYNNPVRKGAAFSSTYFNGIQLGGTAEYDLKNNLSLLTGVLYNFVYSDKIQKYPNLTSVKSISYGHFLDIPLHVTYTYPFSKTLKGFGFAGPNINIGLFQSRKNTSTVSYIPSEYSDLYKDAVLNRLNFQLGVGAGVQWKKYQLKVGYDFGLNNLNKLDTGTLNQNGYYITIGYKF